MLTGQEEILNTVGAPEGETAAEHIDAAADNAELLTILKELPKRDQEVLTQHYGLDTGGGENPPLSLSQIGDKMGITKARVRQLEARALRNLRQLLETRRENLHKATSKG
jgi:RNA polymerase sigma factor (sigma-70 family)